MRLQKPWYIRNKSPANIAASDPPAPGRISSIHGRCANGCIGTREVIKLCDALASCVRVSPRSSEAKDRSSGSVVESWISDVSSVTDLVAISTCARCPFHVPTHLIRLVPFSQRVYYRAILAQLLCCTRVKAIGKLLGELFMFYSDIAGSCEECWWYDLRIRSFARLEI